MDLDVIFLGTGATSPTAERAVASTLILRGPERFLIDCGEGTQRQLLYSRAGMADLDTILLTHGHSDHYLGLPGLLKTYAARNRERPLTVHGPPGTYQLVRGMSGYIGALSFQLRIEELEPGEALARDGFRIEAVRVSHRLPFCYGYKLIEDDRPGEIDAERLNALGVPEGPSRGELARGREVVLEDGRRILPEGLRGPARPGRRILVSGDTAPCEGVGAAAAGVDLLVHEATFLAGDASLAERSGHTTAAQAARIAADAGVGLLAITHLSSRYATSEVIEEASVVYPHLLVPDDLDQVRVPMPERGRPDVIRQGGRAAHR